jgi:hypothetical protein
MIDILRNLDNDDPFWRAVREALSRREQEPAAPVVTWEDSVRSADFDIKSWDDIRDIGAALTGAYANRTVRNTLHKKMQQIAFASPDDAAMAFAMAYYELSDIDALDDKRLGPGQGRSQEYGAQIVRFTADDGNVWYYLYSIQSSADNGSPADALELSRFDSPCPTNIKNGEVKVMAHIHTHPAFHHNRDSDNVNRFSDDDIRLFNSLSYEAFYLVTPQRNVIMINKKSNRHHEIGNIHDGTR